MGVKPGYKQTEAGTIPEDWEIVYLGDIIDYVKGYSFQSVDYRAYGVRIIRVSDTTFDSVRNDNEIFIDSDKAKSYVRWALKKNDLVLSTVGSKPPMYDSMVGRVVIIDSRTEGALLNQNAVLLRSKDKKSMTQTLLLNHFKTKRYSQFIESIFHGNANQASITLKDLFKFPLAIPKKAQEITTIATTLSDADAHISSLNQVIAKKRDLKQAAMQELLIGIRRLPGFNQRWDVKTLGDVGNCLRGVTYKPDTDLYPYETKSTIRLLRANNIQNFTILTSELQHVIIDKVSDQQVMKTDDILICMANGSKTLVGKAGAFNLDDKYRYTFGSFMGCFRTKSIIADPKFINFLFQTGAYRNYITNLLAGSTINNLKSSIIESLEFQIPNRDEQHAIATVLSDMDAELTALEQQRDKTKAIKHGMMQELLTGRIRLV